MTYQMFKLRKCIILRCFKLLISLGIFTKMGYLFYLLNIF